MQIPPPAAGDLQQVAGVSVPLPVPENAPIATGYTGEQRHPLITLPGLPGTGVGAVSARPPNIREAFLQHQAGLAAQAALKANEPYNLSPGERRMIGGSVVAEGAPKSPTAEEANQLRAEDYYRAHHGIPQDVRLTPAEKAEAPVYLKSQEQALTKNDVQRYADSTGMTYAQAADHLKTIGSVTVNALNNPGGSEDKVKYIADQLALDASPGTRQILVGTDKKLERQVADELARRGTTLDQLTAQTRQLAETAKNLLPQFDSTIKEINTPSMQAKLGPIFGRWNEFEAGKIGSGDPAFTKLRTAVDLLKTGALRAHFGARGGQALLGRFDALADIGKMDAETLTSSLKGFRDFLDETYVKPRYGVPVGPSSNKAVNFADLPK